MNLHGKGVKDQIEYWAASIQGNKERGNTTVQDKSERLFFRKYLGYNGDTGVGMLLY